MIYPGVSRETGNDFELSKCATVEGRGHPGIGITTWFSTFLGAVPAPNIHAEPEPVDLCVSVRASIGNLRSFSRVAREE